MVERTDLLRTDPGERPPGTLRLLGALYGSRIRSQLTFRASFASDVAGQVLIVATEFVELWVILGQVGVFGGMTLAQVTAVYGLASLAFGLADMFFEETDRLSSYIRSGKLETLLVRPVPLLLQISSLDLSLRRIGRIGVGLVRAKANGDRVRRRRVVRAVDDISLTIHCGEAVGYVGANGAGKSTTIKMMTGILQPTAGGVQSSAAIRCRNGARSPARSASCSGSAPSCGETCRCGTAT